MNRSASSPMIEAARPAHPTIDPRELLDRWVEAAVISRESADKAWSLYRQADVHPVSGLLRLSAVAELPLYRHYASQLGLDLLSQESTELHALADAQRRAPAELGLATDWLELKGLVVQRGEAGWTIAFRDQVSADTWQLLERKVAACDQRARWVVMTATLADRVYQTLRSTQNAEPAPDDLRALRELAEEGPTIELVNAILSEAVTRRASDLHVEPDEFDFSVRLRIDGQMQELARYAKDQLDAVTCRIKILSSLDIAERRLPQDGRINAHVNGESFDIRVSIMPGVLGESVVLRLLRQERKPTRMQDLGMSHEHTQIFERWIQLANGIVLVTGPTGSGKSTTLYTALELANDKSRKIITVEDPVEYRIPGITQLQVNADIGFTFASALRSILRHDPDMILVGEIRDEETARIAIQSALTGHMVLSTLHTNSAIGAITRLVDMGVEPFLIAASIRGLMAQRLVRRLCRHCAQDDNAERDALQPWLQRYRLEGPAQCKRPVGCVECSGTGFFGRVAIYDLIELTAETGHQIAAGANEAQLTDSIGPHSDQGLMRSGVRLIMDGQTTLAEVIKATAGA